MQRTQKAAPMICNIHLMDRTLPAAGNPPPAGVRYDVLGMGDLFIDYAGGFPAGADVLMAVNRLRTGDALAFRNGDSGIHLTTPDGTPVARLSQQARERWKSPPDSGIGDRPGAGPADRMNHYKDGRPLWVDQCHRLKSAVFGTVNQRLMASDGRHPT